MRPDPALFPDLLSLPLEARRALVVQGGPGWWVQPTKQGPHVYGIQERPAEQAGWCSDAGWALEHGWLWWPCDSAAWMRAACHPGASPAWRWAVVAGCPDVPETWIVHEPIREADPSVGYVAHQAPSAPAAFLAAWRPRD